MNVPRVAPKTESPPDVFELLGSQPNGHSGIVTVPSSQSGSALLGLKSRKPAFHGSFKQAVFMSRDGEDGSSKLQVSFTSAKAKAPKPLELAKQQQQQQQQQQMIVAAGAALPPHIKPKAGPVYRPDILHADKRRTQEDVENVPKPEHLVLAEKELLGMRSLKPFTGQLFGAETFPCDGCGDIFPTEYSLDDHLSRQSYIINVDCPACAERLVFTNKCDMYHHLFTHYPSNRSRAQYVAETTAAVSVLPRNPNISLNKLGVSVKTEPALSGGSVNGAEEAVRPSGDPGQVAEDPAGVLTGDGEAGVSAAVGVTQPDGGLSVKPETQAAASVDRVENVEESVSQPDEQASAEDAGGEAEAEDEESREFECTECGQQFETEWTLRTHFTLTADQARLEVCLPCRVELPTSCSHKAHMRVHGLTPPFTCPDCGVTMHKKNVFLKHLRQQCLHYSKVSEYLCPGCPESFTDAEQQMRHLQAQPQHLRFDGERSYYKCNGCPKAFKSVAAHSKHESCPGAGCTVVHMCNNCTQQTVFRSWAELMAHRSQSHPGLKWIPKRSRIFSCYLCSHRTRSKQGFLDHLLKVHGKKKIDHMCCFCGVEADSLDALEAHKEACPFKREALGVQKPEAVVERKPKLSSSSSVTSDVSSSYAAPSDGDKATTTAATAVTPDAPVTDATYLLHTPSFNCHICAAQCSNYGQLRDHVSRKHKGRGMIYDCWICRDRGNAANFYRQSALDKHMNDVHKIQMNTPLSVSPAPSVDGEGEEELPAKRMKIWSNEGQDYQCCRCDFSSQSAEDFKAHIKRHKSATNDHQCAECGMCFPVQVALRRHLLVVHRVTDYIKYSRLQYAAEYERRLADTKGRCPVCDRQFDEDVMFKKHLRTHGMMYINTKSILSP